tara:strand:- start:4997 stop:5263 length:267 start_codon:yes stop_codon:yes gene_type:complete
MNDPALQSRTPQGRGIAEIILTEIAEDVKIIHSLQKQAQFASNITRIWILEKKLANILERGAFNWYVDQKMEEKNRTEVNKENGNNKN